MNKFVCPKCKLQFETVAAKDVAVCPNCKKFDELVENLKKQQSGGCCG